MIAEEVLTIYLTQKDFLKSEIERNEVLNTAHKLVVLKEEMGYVSPKEDNHVYVDFRQAKTNVGLGIIRLD